MSDLSTGTPAGGGSVAPPSAPVDNGGPLTVREAADAFQRKAEQNVSDAGRTLAEQRGKLRASTAPAAINQPVSQPQSAPEAPAADQSADEADATSPPTEEPNGETSETDLESKTPLIDPPSSWTSEQRQRWANLDQETQKYLVEYDKKLSSEVSRAQKEAAEQLKGLTAREQAMEQQRLQMEAITIAKAQEYRKLLQRDFPDIQNFEDLKKLAEENWGRYNQFQVLQQELAAEAAQEQAALQRQASEAQAKFAKFADEQDKKFIERAPDFADKDKAAKLKEGAIAALKDAGFSDDELGKHWNGQAEISMRDHRVQLLFADAARYRQAQESAKKAVANKSLPPVQRPGVAQAGKPNLNDKLTWIRREQKTATGTRAVRLGAAAMQIKHGVDVNLSELRKD